MRFKQSVRYGDWKFFEVQLAWGPIAIGDTGDGSYRTLFSKLYVGYLDESTNRLVLLARDGSSWVPVDESLFPQPPHPVGEIRHIAVAFDQAARLVMAYERAGEVFVYQWDPSAQEYVVRGPFPGADPVLINDATVGFYPPDSDVLLFHLSPDRTSLVMRVQRELYATAHTIQTFDQPVVLDQAVALPHQVELLGSFLDALEATGYAVRSDIYLVYLSEVAASPVVNAPVDWDYIPIVVTKDVGMELAASGSVSPPTAWDYIPIVVIKDLGTEVAASAAVSAPVGWNYIPVVISKDLGTEVAASASVAAPTAWNYPLVVVVYNGGVDVAASASVSAPMQWNYYV